MDGLHAGGVRVGLAIASASSPPWFSHAHPESLPDVWKMLVVLGRACQREPGLAQQIPLTICR
ncbi:beta-galactosidase [Polymorphospora sp. NPDC051019]|uniref:beta-galactosidase n=1 Tax=Polymorphospora sp. NPDC051019 TaxID=3155725 RepID=UPI0034217719